MSNKLFNILLIAVLAIWIAISLILPAWLGFIALFALGILILLVLFLWVRRYRKKLKFKSKVFGEPRQFRDISQELKDLFEREKSKEEVKDEDNKEKVKIEKTAIKKAPLYVASTKGGKYHLDTCRFSKLIKEKYRLEDDSKDFFTRRKYPACQVCKPDRKS